VKGREKRGVGTKKRNALRGQGGAGRLKWGEETPAKAEGMKRRATSDVLLGGQKNENFNPGLINQARRKDAQVPYEEGSSKVG